MFAAQEIQSANLVRELRFRLGLTQEQFAAELGVTFARSIAGKIAKCNHRRWQ
jgi:transcriptional regulator with XRE-family HTH domain